jgi:hypothetical protein
LEYGSKTSGNAECYIVEHLHYRGAAQTLEKAPMKECSKEMDTAGHLLGGSFRMAIYDGSLAHDECNTTLVRTLPSSSLNHTSRRVVIYAGRPIGSQSKRAVFEQMDVFWKIQQIVHKLRPDLDVVDFHTEKYNTQKRLDNQMLLFSRAAVIIGAHGGALANLVYMKPGCNNAVIEFVGDEVTDIYRDSHREMTGGHLAYPYKSLHYAYYGSLVNYTLGVYDKISGISKRNQMSIPLDDLETILSAVLDKVDMEKG